ncbi:MAG: hypothetical protein ChlgKO_09800 [Chlamydiales bacterium]
MKNTKFAIISLSVALMLHPSKAHSQGLVNKFFEIEDETDVLKRELKEREQEIAEQEKRNTKIAEELALAREQIEEEKILLGDEYDRLYKESKKAKQDTVTIESSLIEKQKELASRLAEIEEKEALLRKTHRGFASFMTVPECKESLQQNSFFAYDPLPISNWLANVNLDSFYHYRTRAILEKDDVYQNSYEVWLEPFVQHSNWNEADTSSKFNAYGFTLGAGVVIHDNYEIGLGFGYWRTDLDGDKNNDRFESDTDTFIFGPYFSWFFAQEGYLSTMLWGGFNDHHVERKGEFCGLNQIGERDHSSWHLAARAELGYTFYGQNFFLKPFAVFDYLSDYQEDYSEKTRSIIGWEESLKVESRHSNFLGTKVALECGTEINRRGVRFLIPKLTLGWLYYQPLSQDGSEVAYFSPPQSKLGDFTIDHDHYSSDNLLFAEGEATFLHMDGFSTSFSFGASIGSIYKNYTGAIRIERVW